MGQAVLVSRARGPAAPWACGPTHVPHVTHVTHVLPVQFGGSGVARAGLDDVRWVLGAVCWNDDGTGWSC